MQVTYTEKVVKAKEVAVIFNEEEIKDLRWLLACCSAGENKIFAQRLLIMIRREMGEMS